MAVLFAEQAKAMQAEIDDLRAALQDLPQAPTAKSTAKALSLIVTEYDQTGFSLLGLADRIDPDKLWQRPLFERDRMSQQQRDQMDAGVNLRRYADLHGGSCWRIYPPRPGISYAANTLDNVVNLAKRQEEKAYARAIEGYLAMYKSNFDPNSLEQGDAP